MHSLGIDLGFYQVKVSSKTKDRKFPSVIGYPSSIELQSQADLERSIEDDIAIKDRDTVYYVGQKALEDTKNSQLTFVTDKTDRHTDRVKYLAALGLSSLGGTHTTFHVVTGLPVDEYAGVQGLKEKLQENMQGVFDFAFSNTQQRIEIPKVTVIPQSAGAYYDYIMDRDGVIDEGRVNPKTMVVDIGYRTTDVVTMRNARYSPSESFTVSTGVSDVHKEVRKLLLRTHRLNKDVVDIDEIVRTRKIYLSGQEHDVTSLILEAVRPYVEKILSNIPLYIDDMREVHQVLVTGGGANLMINYFLQEFEDDTQTQDNQIPVEHMKASEFSNARGYYKYGLFLEENA